METLKVGLSELKIKNKVLDKFFSGETSLEEFDMESAYMALEYLDYYKYQPFPDPPQEIIKYAKKRTQGAHTTETFNLFASPETANWYRLLGTWRANNKSNFEWLLFLQQNLKTEDEKYRVKVMLEVFDNHEEWWLFGKKFIEFIAINYSTPEEPLLKGKKTFEYE